MFWFHRKVVLRDCGIFLCRLYSHISNGSFFVFVVLVLFLFYYPPLHSIHSMHSILWFCVSITKICLYNFDPPLTRFYAVKLGFKGVYISFLISAKKHRLWVLVRTASTRRFYRVPTIYVLSRNTKNIRIFV